MKKNYLYVLLLMLMAPFVLLTGCEDDEAVNEEPRIIMSTTRASLNEILLDENAGPTFRGWAVAEAGLEQVLIVAQTTGGTQELLNVTSFTEENSEMGGTRYNFVVLPEYTPDFTGLTITVTDVQGRSTDLSFDVAATGGTSGPTMAGFATEGVKANIRETVNVRPAIEGTVQSHFGLASVRYIAMFGDTEEELEVVNDFGDTPNEHIVNFVPDYDEGYQRGLTAIIIEGTDDRGYTNEVTIPVTVVDADPAPEVAFDQESVEADLTADPQVTPAVSGTVSTEYSGLAEVRFYLVYGSEEVEITEEAKVFAQDEADASYTFNFTPEYSLGLQGIRVVAVDDAGEDASETLPVTVIAEDPDLQAFNNVTVNAQADRNDAGVVTNFSALDGQAYTLAEGLDSEVSSKIDFITADSGGDNGLDLFSPSHSSWLANNYFKKDAAGDMTWPVLNETRMVHLENRDAAFFNSATSIDIRNLEVGTDATTRIEFGPDANGNHLVNQVILFETTRGQKGLLLFKESDNAAGKSDSFTFDIKVINE